jgi:formimidoylglutamate deiminase
MHSCRPGWARDVVLEWSDDGVLTRVQAGADPGAHARAAGPVLPGMANVHSHAFQRAMTGLAEFRGHPTDDFWTWREEMYRLVRLLAPEDVEAIARHLYVEMLKHGYTTVAEFHYMHNDAEGRPYANRAELAERILAGARDSGIAMTLLPVLYAHGGFGHKPLSAAQRRFAGTPATIVELLSDLATFHLPSPLLRLGVAPHSVRAVDALMLTELVDAASRLDATLPIHMHVSEQTGRSGRMPRDPRHYAARMGERPGGRRRAVVLHPRDPPHRGRDAARGGRAAPAIGLCPVTEANLGDGIFELRAVARVARARGRSAATAT